MITTTPSLGRILVVDDEPNIRAALVRALNLSHYETSEAASGAQALALLTTAHFDLMILDLRMPGMDGTEVMAQAHTIAPQLLILVLTGHATVESAIAAVKSHAVDYMLKPMHINDIVTAVGAALQARREQAHRIDLVRQAAEALRQVESLNGDIDQVQAPAEPVTAAARPTPSGQIHAGLLTLNLTQRTVYRTGNPPQTAELTEGEARVLAFLMGAPNHVFSCREATRHIWDYDLDEWEANSLIRPYIFRLRQKIETAGEPQLICTVRGRGYLFKV
ncbi:MAG: response regulator transcription factor [Anaerolineae bacterium]